MIVKVKLFATLRTGRFEVSEMELSSNTKIYELVNKLRIDKKDAAIIFINGIHADFDSAVKDGDDVAIFPPIGGG